MPKKERERVAQQVIGKMYTDVDFAKLFKTNPDEALEKVVKEYKIELDSNDKTDVKKIIKDLKSPLPFLTQEEMKTSILDITNKADEGYKKVQGMSNVLFAMGIGIIVAAFILDLYGVIMEENWQPLIASSGVLGGIGVVTIYGSTYKLPNKVKNYVADLVQIKVVVFGYFDELLILMSDDLKTKDPDQAIKIVNQINDATDEVMNKIQKYCEFGQYDKASKSPTS